MEMNNNNELEKGLHHLTAKIGSCKPPAPIPECRNKPGLKVARWMDGLEGATIFDSGG